MGLSTVELEGPRTEQHQQQLVVGNILGEEDRHRTRVVAVAEVPHQIDPTNLWKIVRCTG